MALPKLSNELLRNGHPFPGNVSVPNYGELPEKVLQFGEGNFLRGFVDWMIHRMNQKKLFNGKVVLVQPIAQGMCDLLNRQDGLYTLLLRGVQDGKVVDEREVVGSVSRGLNPYSQFDEYLKCAHNPELRFIVSNTTEAGIAFSAADKLTDQPPASFPGKLTQFLLERYKAFKADATKGLVILPCELIEHNGSNLKKCVLQQAAAWGLEKAFVDWLNNANVFANTLVDRIVTGYPREEVSKLSGELGYEDSALNTGEIFHAWVIEAPASVAKELPLTEIGLNVTWTDDYAPYRDRKVRILNGAHTMTVLAACLGGKDTVGECMDDPAIRSYLRNGLDREIIPTLNLPKSDLDAFAAAVLERFANPFIKHQLLSIALNSTSKFKARVLPSIREYVKRKGELPKRLTFSLAALIAFYRGTEIRDGALIGHRNGQEYKIQDDAAAMEAFRLAWSEFDKSHDATALVTKVLSAKGPWAEDLNAVPGLTAAVTNSLESILRDGALAALKTVDAGA